MKKSKVFYEFDNIKITEKDITQWNDYQEYFTFIKMTNQQFLDVIKTNKLEDWKEFLTQAVTDEFETSMREQFMNMLSYKLTGRSWGEMESFVDENGDDIEMSGKKSEKLLKNWRRDFYKNATKAGYQNTSVIGMKRHKKILEEIKNEK